MLRLSTLPSWVFTILIIGSIVLGSSLIYAMRDPVAQPAPKIQPVATVRLVVQDTLTIEKQFAATVEAKQSAQLAFERPGTIATVLVEEGDFVTKGDTLATLDNRRLLAQQASLEATVTRINADLALAKRIEKRQRSLKDANFNSANEYDQAVARVSVLDAQRNEARAQLQSLAIDIERLQLKAPFDGHVVARTGHQGSFIAAYQPLLTLVQGDAARIRAGVPVEASRSLAPNTSVTIINNGERYSGTVSQRSQTIDQRTRSVQVLIALDAASPLIYGDVVSLVFSEQRAIAGYWIPTKSLISGPRGTWQLRAIKANSNLAELLAVNIVDIQADQAYVTGNLSDYDRIISGGNHKLAPNQPIDAIEAAQ